MRNTWALVGAVSAFFWVAVGAATGHSLHPGIAGIYLEKAQRYHIVHSLALLYLSEFRAKVSVTPIALLWLLGLCFFSGSLYLMALWGWPLRYFVPIGGMAYLLGWLWLSLNFWKMRE